MTKHLTWIGVLVMSVALLVSCGSPQYAQNDGRYDRGRNGNWELLGERRADARSRQAAIYPRGRYNNFSQLRFTTTGGDINLYSATVVYDNGRRESYKLNMGNRNGATRSVRLGNRNGGIRQIELNYSTDRYNRGRGQGSILVYGR